MTIINSGLKGLSMWEPVWDIRDLHEILHEITMTLSINLVWARVRQQFIVVVNGLCGPLEYISKR